MRRNIRTYRAPTTLTIRFVLGRWYEVFFEQNRKLREEKKVQKKWKRIDDIRWLAHWKMMTLSMIRQKPTP